MSRDIRSTSAHDAMVKTSKEYIKSNRVNLWPENEYYDRETLYLKLQQQKEETNLIKDENTKLKTRLSQYEVLSQQFEQKELTAYYKLFEEQKVNLLVKSKPSDIQVHQMRSQNKQLLTQIYEKNAQIDLFKRNIKLTKYQELEVENRLLKEELQRLRSIVVQQELQFKKVERYNLIYKKLSQVSESNQIKDHFLKTQQNYLRKKNENEELSSRLQKQDDYIKSLKKDIDSLTVKKQKLETEISKISKSRYPDDKSNSQKVTNSSNSFRNKLDKSESSNQSIKPRFQEELQLKLILRGVTTSQLDYMLDDLKQQASNIKKSINKDDISYILAREPFSLQQDKIVEVVKSLKGQGDGLADQLQNYIGSYKSFNEISNFSLEKAEQTVIESLKDNESKISKYFSQKKQQFYDKGDLNLFIDEMNFGWDEGTKLFYLINVFEKSGEKLQFEEANMIDPFMSIQQSERIIEESEEDVFDRNSEVQEATEEQEQDSI